MTPPRKSRREKTLFMFNMALSALVMGLFLLLQAQREVAAPEWPYSAAEVARTVPISELRALLDEEGAGRRIAILGERILVETETGAGERRLGPDDLDAKGRYAKVVTTNIPFPNSFFISELVFREDLLGSGYELAFFPEAEALSGAAIFSIAMQVLFIGALLFLILSMTGKGLRGGMFGTEKGFELMNVKDLRTSLSDVAGLDNARDEIEEVIALMRDEGAAARAGGRLPRGLLLDGPPGTGKTLIARAMAREAGVSFIRVDASSLSQMFVGLGAMKVRRLFRLARKNAPCIIFIDEIDAVGGARGNGGGGGGEQEKDNTLNALLTELDGFEARSGIFVIAATNRPEILDPALTRPGRIDRRITMQLPDIQARHAILEVHARGKRLAPDVDLRAIAATAYNMSGAQLENLVNEAALLAGRQGRDEIRMRDFAEARDRQLMPQSGGRIGLMADERRITAVHEAGHAVAAILSPHADPVEKVTIVPRGGALGFVLQSPERDRVFESRARLKARIVVAAAGRQAEKIVLGEDMVTTGAATDIRQATAIAQAMVYRYGMSEIGFIAIDPGQPGQVDAKNPPCRIVSEMIDAGLREAERILSAHRDALDRLTEALLDRETLSGAEARAIVLTPVSTEGPA